MLVFVVVGRLGKSLTISKVVPFLATGKVSKVFIFRQETGFPLNGAHYVTLPSWLTKLKPRHLGILLRSLYEPLQLYVYTKKYKPALINGVFTLPKGLNATIIGKLTNTPSVVSVIGGIVEITTRFPFQRFWEGLNLWMLRTCSVVTTKGKVVTSYLVKKGIPKEKIFTLNGSIDTDNFRYKNDVRKDIDILFVGNLSPLKGPDRVLKMVEILKAKTKDITAVILGDGILYKAIKQQIQDHGLEDNVKLLGYINNPIEWFQKSKCIVIPSESEGLPTAMLEAMACGCVPIVQM